MLLLTKTAEPLYVNAIGLENGVTFVNNLMIDFLLFQVDRSTMMCVNFQGRYSLWATPRLPQSLHFLYISPKFLPPLLFLQ